MNYFILLLFLLTFLYILLMQCKLKNKGKIYCVCSGLLLLVLAGFRAINTGLNDTEMIYIPEFNAISIISFSKVLQYKDTLFYILTKLYTYVFKGYRLWLILIDIPLIYTVSKKVYKSSRNYLISFLIFLALGFYTLSSYTVLRHAIALAIIVKTIDYISEKKLAKFIFGVVLAACFHQTAIIFLPAYWLINFVNLKLKYMYILLSFVLSILLKNFLGNIIYEIALNSSRYQFFLTHSTGIGYTYFFIHLCIIIFCDMFSNKKYRETKEYELFTKLVVMANCIFAFMPILGEFQRVGMFYSISIIILLPNAIMSIENRNTRIAACLLAYFLFSAYFLLFAIPNAGLTNYTMDI